MKAFDLQVYLEMDTTGEGNNEGEITKIQLFKNSHEVTDPFNVNKTFANNSTENTGWLTIPVKSSCTKDQVNKIQIWVNDDINYKKLIVMTKSGDTTKTKVDNNNQLLIAKSRSMSLNNLQLVSTSS